MQIVRGYWPLLAVPFVAVGIGFVLHALGDPWSLKDVASNVILGYVVTLATVMMSRRQSRLQEAFAVNEMTEKIAAMSGIGEWIRGDFSPNRVQQLLVDARAGLSLFRLGVLESQIEYLETMDESLGHLIDSFEKSLRSYSVWTDGDWAGVRREAAHLEAVLERQTAGLSLRNDGRFAGATSKVGKIARWESSKISFEMFQRVHRDGPAANRIRASLDWAKLAQVAGSAGGLQIEIHRHGNEDVPDLSKVFTPWYEDGNGNEVGWDHSEASSITLGKIGLNFDAIPASKRESVRSMARDFVRMRTSDPILVEIATYSMGEREVILLDGNHRLAAILGGRTNKPHYRIPARIVEYRLFGPQDSQILPDLRPHLGT